MSFRPQLSQRDPPTIWKISDTHVPTRNIVPINVMEIPSWILRYTVRNNHTIDWPNMFTRLPMKIIQSFLSNPRGMIRSSIGG